MDIHSVLATAVREVLAGVEAARKEVGEKVKIGDPTSVELEFGISSSYELANYDDIRVATVRVRVPVFPTAVEPVTELTTKPVGNKNKK